jgi:hypothetical protein
MCARTETIKELHQKMLVGNHKTNTARGKLTKNETTTIAMKFY